MGLRANHTGGRVEIRAVVAKTDPQQPKVRMRIKARLDDGRGASAAFRLPTYTGRYARPCPCL
jgi:hypothetical protein